MVEFKQSGMDQALNRTRLRHIQHITSLFVYVNVLMFLHMHYFLSNNMHARSRPLISMICISPLFPPNSSSQMKEEGKGVVL